MAGRLRAELRTLAELLAVCGVAVAQPTFDLLGRNGGLFVLWRVSPLRLVALAVIVLLVPPMALYVVEVVVGLVHRSVRVVVHRVFLALALGIAAAEAVKRYTQLSSAWIVVGGLVVAGAAAYLCGRAVVRNWLHFLAIAPVVFALVFVFASPVTPIAFDRDVHVAGAKTSAPTRVVMLVLDELPLTSLLDGTGHIDAELFHNLAAFANDSTWYRNDATVSPYTSTAVPAILTGMRPKHGTDVPFLSTYPRNLFTLLQPTHTLHVREAATELCPASWCGRPPRATTVRTGFGGMLQDVADIWRDFALPTRQAAFSFDGIGTPDYNALQRAESYVDAINPSAKPTFDFLHVLLPHFPWHYLPSGQDDALYPGHTNGFVNYGWPNDAVGNASRVRHLLQIQAVDGLVGRLMARLKAIHEYDNSLIIVTADHGASFAGGEPFRLVSKKNWTNIAYTPLLVKYPHQQAGRIDDRIATDIDIVPTIADVLHMKIPWHVDGHSLLGPKVSDPARPLLTVPHEPLHATRGEYMVFDGRAGFAQLLRALDAPKKGHDLFRVYRTSQGGGLIGQPISAEASAPAGVHAAVDRLAMYQVVLPFNPLFPYSDVHGFVDRVPAGTPIVVAVNGVAAVTTITQKSSGGRSEFWGLIPQPLLRGGRNTLGILVPAGPTRFGSSYTWPTTGWESVPTGSRTPRVAAAGPVDPDASGD